MRAAGSPDPSLAAQNTIMLWLAGIFAAFWALINGLVHVFYKMSEFTSPVAPATTSPA